MALEPWRECRKAARHVPVVLLACIACLTGCVQVESASNASPSTSQTDAPPKPSPDFANIPGQFVGPPTLTPNGEAQAPVGACANLSGTTTDAILSIVDCNSLQNTYRVVRRVNTPQECGDTDRSYYHNSQSTGQYTACLDLAWDSTTCIALGPLVSKVNCADPNISSKIKPTMVILNTTTLDGCSDGGYTHPARRFTVCTQTQEP
ncbi:LppU/SCO3897 family protein [Mycolicibacterium sp. HS_4_1]